MKRPNILFVVGVRPNFVKVAPLLHYADKIGIKYTLMHTGQHYDANMSSVQFRQLGINNPDIIINRDSIKEKYERNIKFEIDKLITFAKPDFAVIFGDTDSAYITAKIIKNAKIKIVHVESGLRSREDIPEDINRNNIDHLADIHFVTEPSAVRNLKKENVKGQIYYVGNLMIDSLVSNIKLIKKKPLIKSYVVATIHRQDNVDNKKTLQNIFSILNSVSNKFNLKIHMPIHPRTSKMIKEFKIDTGEVNLISPMGYIDFNKLIANTLFVLTDSGGVQDETSYLNIPCITLRSQTERKITVSRGTNSVVGVDIKKIHNLCKKILSGTYKKSKNIATWDGHSAERIINRLIRINNKKTN